MQLFKKSPKTLKGKICHERSGVYVELFGKWEAIRVAYDTFLIGYGNKSGTCVMFTINHFIEFEGKPITHLETGEDVTGVWVQDGRFACMDLDMGEGNLIKIWQIETNQYSIKLTYVHTKEYMDKYGEDIKKIVNTLVVPEMV